MASCRCVSCQAREFAREREEKFKKAEEALFGNTKAKTIRQVGGDHYHKRAIEPITYVLENGLGYCEGSIIKYVTRHQDKGKAEDIKKLIHFATFILEHDYGITASVEYEDI